HEELHIEALGGEERGHRAGTGARGFERWKIARLVDADYHRGAVRGQGLSVCCSDRQRANEREAHAEKVASLHGNSPRERSAPKFVPYICGSAMARRGVAGRKAVRSGKVADK